MLTRVTRLTIQVARVMISLAYTPSSIGLGTIGHDFDWALMSLCIDSK